MDTIKCQRCGTENPAWRSDCENCKSNLRDPYKSSPYQKKEPNPTRWIAFIALAGIAFLIFIYSVPLYIMGYSTPKAVEDVRDCYPISGPLVVDPNTGRFDLAAMEKSEKNSARMVIRTEVIRISSGQYKPIVSSLSLGSQYTVTYPVVLVTRILPGVWKVSCTGVQYDENPFYNPPLP